NQTLHVAMDEKQIGREIAEWTAKQLGGKGTVAMLTGPSGVPTFRNLADGYTEVMAKYPDIKIVFRTDAPLTLHPAPHPPQRPLPRGARATHARDGVGRPPVLAAIYPVNDGGGPGAMQGVAPANRRGKPIVTAMNGTPPGLRAVKDGNIAMTVELNPVLWGRLGVDVLARYLKGEKVEPQVFIKHEIVDGNNIDAKLPKS